jgi:prophage maintenance system killer protein
MVFHLTGQDVVRIHHFIDPANGLKARGLNMIETSINNARLQGSTSDRAASLALSLSINQPFTDGNTRTAVAVLYLVLRQERSVVLRGKPYQAYGMIKDCGHASSHGDLVQWINRQGYAGNGEHEWDALMRSIIALGPTLGEIVGARKTDDNRSDPGLRNLLKQRTAFLRTYHGGNLA